MTVDNWQSWTYHENKLFSVLPCCDDSGTRLSELVFVQIGVVRS
jgi:hypothetical protein